MSRIAPMILAAALGGAVVGGIVWFTRPAPPATPAAAPETAAATAASAAAPAGAGQTAPPPWANADGSAGGLGAAIGAAPIDPKKAQARAEIRSRITALTANGRHPTPSEMNALLGDLERVEGSSVISGVNIGALRSNLVKVDEMQRLGMEMKAETEKPGGGNPQKVQEILARLQKLQSEMRLDITVPTPAPSAPTPAK